MLRCVPWVAAVLSIVGTARAQSAAPPPTVAPPSPWAERPFAIDAVLGLATPVGLGGVTLEYAPFRYFSLGGGIGMNLEGPQLAGVARVRFTPDKPLSIFVGAGYTRGPHRQTQLTAFGVLGGAAVALLRVADEDWKANVPPERYWSAAQWLNAELGVEKRQPNGFDLRAFIGVAALLNPSGNVLEQPYPQSHRTEALGVVPFTTYTGAALGFSL
jgi:hypothetical protein